MWDAKTGKQLLSLSPGAECRRVAFSPRQDLLTAAAGTVLSSVGTKEGWYYIEGGGWIPEKAVREVDPIMDGVRREAELTLEARANGRSPKILKKPADVDKAIPAGTAKRPDSVAVIIAVEKYKSKSVPAVEYAMRDASTVRKYLLKTLGYRKGNIIFLENPTKGDLERVFGSEKRKKGQLYNYVKAGKSDVFVYYSGHGAPDAKTQRPYLVPTDSHPDYVALSGYPLDVLYENLSKVPARTSTLVIEACFSGESQKGMLFAEASSIAIVPRAIDVPSNINVFTASGGEEMASWYSEKGHGLFTYFFLKALRGESDADENGAVTLGEIERYVGENVPYWGRRLHGREQLPKFRGDRGLELVSY